MDAPNVKRSCYEKRFLPATMYGRYSFINVIGGQAEKEGDEHNRKNMVEVAIVMKILRYLFKGMPKWRIIFIFSSQKF